MFKHYNPFHDYAERDKIESILLRTIQEDHGDARNAQPGDLPAL